MNKLTNWVATKAMFKLLGLALVLLNLSSMPALTEDDLEAMQEEPRASVWLQTLAIQFRGPNETQKTEGVARINPEELQYLVHENYDLVLKNFPDQFHQVVGSFKRVLDLLKPELINKLNQSEYFRQCSDEEKNALAKTIEVKLANYFLVSVKDLVDRCEKERFKEACLEHALANVKSKHVRMSYEFFNSLNDDGLRSFVEKYSSGASCSGPEARS